MRRHAVRCCAVPCCAGTALNVNATREMSQRLASSLGARWGPAARDYCAIGVLNGANLPLPHCPCPPSSLPRPHTLNSSFHCGGTSARAARAAKVKEQCCISLPLCGGESCVPWPEHLLTSSDVSLGGETECSCADNG